jgi:hypothetical protein
MTVLAPPPRAARWISYVSTAWIVAGVAGAIYYGLTR